MAEKTVDLEGSKKEFLSHLPADGRAVGNGTIQKLLDWSPEDYIEIKKLLIDEGKVRTSRGRGGAVRLTDTLAKKATSSAEQKAKTAGKRPTEASYYPPFKEGLNLWAADQAWKGSLVAETAHQGKRNTGGEWTRPDFLVAGYQKFDYTPGVTRDIETFEVKPAHMLNMQSVFETAAHSRSATKSYLAVVGEVDSIDEAFLTRVEEECQRFGIGLILCKNPKDPASWDYRVDPLRREPDPELLEAFIQNQFPKTEQSTLRGWLH